MPGTRVIDWDSYVDFIGSMDSFPHAYQGKGDQVHAASADRKGQGRNGVRMQAGRV